MPVDILFLEEGIYRWGATDEAAVSAYWLGDHLSSFALAMHLLDNDLLPESERLRVETNRDYGAPAVAAHAAQYPRGIVAQLVAARAARQNPDYGDASTVDTTLTIAGCKRLELFEQPTFCRSNPTSCWSHSTGIMPRCSPIAAKAAGS